MVSISTFQSSNRCKKQGMLRCMVFLLKQCYHISLQCLPQRQDTERPDRHRKVNKHRHRDLTGDTGNWNSGNQDKQSLQPRIQKCKNKNEAQRQTKKRRRPEALNKIIKAQIITKTEDNKDQSEFRFQTQALGQTPKTHDIYYIYVIQGSPFLQYYHSTRANTYMHIC